MILYLMLRYTKLSRSARYEKTMSLKMIAVVAYFQLPKVRLDLGADNFAMDFRISLAEKKIKPVSTVIF